jgi:uncharacterized paraquat-inducible protein A
MADYLEDEEEDYDAEDEHESTIACPHCRKQIYDDVEQCPYCGQYISEEDRTSGQKPWWIVVGFVLCFLVVIYWLII